MEKLYKGARYERRPEGFFRIVLPDGGWTKFFGTEKECRAFIRMLMK